jgi:transcriptional regulator with XRE-family HTH domain
MIIGEIIKRRRTALDMTQVELAEKAKITQAKISQIENGANDNVTIDVLRKLAKALNCALIDLLPEEDKLKTR